MAKDLKHSFRISLASEFDISTAAIFNTLEFWVKSNQEQGIETHQMLGIYWTWFSRADLHKKHKYIPLGTIGKILIKLEDFGIIKSIITEDLPSKKIKKGTKAYTINWSILDELESKYLVPTEQANANLVPTEQAACSHRTSKRKNLVPAEQVNTINTDTINTNTYKTTTIENFVVDAENLELEQKEEKEFIPYGQKKLSEVLGEKEVVSLKTKQSTDVACTNKKELIKNILESGYEFVKAFKERTRYGDSEIEILLNHFYLLKAERDELNHRTIKDFWTNFSNWTRIPNINLGKIINESQPTESQKPTLTKKELIKQYQDELNAKVKEGALKYDKAIELIKNKIIELDASNI